MPIKMIVTDLDRTLLRTDKTISDYTAEVLNACRQRGIKVVFATARSLRRVQDFIRGVPINALLAINGAVVYVDSNIIADYPIPTETVNAALHKLNGNEIKKIAAETDEMAYSNHHAPNSDIVQWGFGKAVSGKFYRITAHHDDSELIRSLIGQFDDLRLYTVFGIVTMNLPLSIQAHLDGYNCTTNTLGCSAASVLMFSNEHERLFLKTDSRVQKPRREAVKALSVFVLEHCLSAGFVAPGVE
jgi:HAD superfamily hydrolase (TIGR01484 family)